jgi:hypothetical protein
MSAAQFPLRPGVGHVVSSDMRSDVRNFFVAAMPEPDAALIEPAALCRLVRLAARPRRYPMLGLTLYEKTGCIVRVRARTARARSSAAIEGGIAPLRAVQAASPEHHPIQHWLRQFASRLGRAGRRASPSPSTRHPAPSIRHGMVTDGRE